MIVGATSRCLRMIKDDLQIPSVLPASMSSKFRLGTTLATACQVGLLMWKESCEQWTARQWMYIPTEGIRMIYWIGWVPDIWEGQIARVLKIQLMKMWTKFRKEVQTQWYCQHPTHIPSHVLCSVLISNWPYCLLWYSGGPGGSTTYNSLYERLRLKGVPFSGFRYMKGHGFYSLKYMKG